MRGRRPIRYSFPAAIVQQSNATLTTAHVMFSHTTFRTGTLSISMLQCKIQCAMRLISAHPYILPLLRACICCCNYPSVSKLSNIDSTTDVYIVFIQTVTSSYILVQHFRNIVTTNNFLTDAILVNLPTIATTEKSDTRSEENLERT